MEAILQTIKDAEERYTRGLEQAEKEKQSVIDSARKQAQELKEKEKRRIEQEQELTLQQSHETIAQEKAKIERSGQEQIQKVKDASNTKQTTQHILRLVQESV